MASLDVDGLHMDRRTATAQLAREEEPGTRRRIFLAMEPAWNVVDPDDVEPTMRRIVAAFRPIALGSDLVEPCDYRFVVGGLARRLDSMIPVGRLREINDAHLASIGADPAGLRVHYDIHPRPDRPVIPTAFTVTEDVAHL